MSHALFVVGFWVALFNLPFPCNFLGALAAVLLERELLARTARHA